MKLCCKCCCGPETKHRAFSIGGLLLTGTGLSVFGEALLRKSDPAARPVDWVPLGTLALVLVNAGVCLVVEAARQKAKAEAAAE